MITSEQLDLLGQPFEAQEHEMRFGHGNQHYVTWLAYLTRPAITKRVKEVLNCALSDRIVNTWFDEHTKQYDKKYNVIVEVWKGDEVFQAIGTDSDYMSAETRAYKRALTHLHIGLYLYGCPVIQTRNEGYYDHSTKKVKTWTNEYKTAQNQALLQLSQWLNGGSVGSQSSTPSNTTNNSQPSSKSSSKPSDFWTLIYTDKDIKALYEHNNHIKSTLDQYQGDVQADGFDKAKSWLLNRKATA